MSLYNTYGVSTQQCFSSLLVVLVDLHEDVSPQVSFPKGMPASKVVLKAADES